MELGTLLTTLSALRAHSDEQLATLHSLAQHESPDRNAVLGELVRLFDLADAHANVAAMSVVHDAIVEMRTEDTPPDSLAAATTPPPVQASEPPPRPSLGKANARTGRHTPPAPTPDKPNAVGGVDVIVASGAPGESLPEAFARKWERLARGGRDGHEQVGRFVWRDAYPEPRRLTGDPISDTAKIRAVTAPDVLVASGGICGPAAVDYSIPTFATPSRPLRDGLPQFQASRGALRFLAPPTLSETASGITIWTEATDANPGGATKPVVTITCPSENEVFVDAVPLRIQMGNLLNMFAPELAAAFLDTALAEHARVAERNLLSKISAASTSVSSAQLLGASRDLLATVDQAAAAYRYRGRIPRSARLRLVAPDWTKDMLRADVARELAHDSQGIDPRAVSDSDIEAWLAVRGVDPIWTLDGVDASVSGVTYGNQYFGTQGANAGLLDWPHSVVFWLYVEGSFQFLDGGELDIEIIRDATLSATNDMQTFMETFEAVAFRGIEALQVAATVRPNGESAAATSTASY